MQHTLSEKIRIAAQELRLNDSQRNIVAARLTRALLKVDPEIVSVEEVRQLIQEALVGVPGEVAYAQKEQQERQEQEQPAAVQVAVEAQRPEIIEVEEDAYRVNHVVRRTSSG